MERRKSESISDVINRYLRASQLESPLNEYRAIQKWNEICSEETRKSTIMTTIANNTLYVRIANPTLRCELTLQRARLLRKLQAEINDVNIVREIVFQ